MQNTDETKPTHITLSHYTKALFENLRLIKPKVRPDETSRISVSPTASFFALAYEKVRNAVEYRESHLIRKSAIDRILRRRLALNSEGKGEAENLIRELLWARYFPNESLGLEDVEHVQDLIDKYLFLQKTLSATYSDFVFDLMVCEIEEILSPEEAKRNALFTFYMYQILKEKVRMTDTPEEQKNITFYVALEKAYSRSDVPYLRFHLFTLSHKPLAQLSHEDISNLAPKLPDVFDRINDVIKKAGASDAIQRFIKAQTPPFHILFEIIKKEGPEKTEKIISWTNTFWHEVNMVCMEKYAQTRSRLTGLGIKAIIYIFVTKMIFALIIEGPVSQYIYHEINITALIINSLFPPFLMFLIVALTRLPNEQNTRRIYDRLVDVVDADKSFETTVSFVARKARQRRPVLVFFFTIFYLLTFIITFSLLHELLNLIQFNMISQLVFFFFVSLVAFFGYRVVQVAKQYKLKEKDTFFRPFIDFFFMPFLSVGKFFSANLARINIFGFLFDFFIEAPFKIIIEVIEEWITFVRNKRDEII